MDSRERMVDDVCANVHVHSFTPTVYLSIEDKSTVVKGCMHMYVKSSGRQCEIDINIFLRSKYLWMVCNQYGNLDRKISST